MLTAALCAVLPLSAQATKAAPVTAAKQILKQIQPAPTGIKIGAKKNQAPPQPVFRGGFEIAPGWQNNTDQVKQPEPPTTAPKVVAAAGNKILVNLKHPKKSEAKEAVIKGNQVEVYPASKFEFPIQFSLDSYALTEGYSTRQLDELAKALQESPKSQFLIEGHTCDLGDDSYNDWLSAARAMVVKAYLMSKGVAESQLICRGFGEADALGTPNKTYTAKTNEEIRSKNRRVVIRMVKSVTNK